MSDKNISSLGNNFSSWNQLKYDISNDENVNEKSDIVTFISNPSSASEKSDKIKKKIGNLRQLQNEAALTVYNTLVGSLSEIAADFIWDKILGQAPPAQGGGQYITLAQFNDLDEVISVLPPDFPDLNDLEHLSVPSPEGDNASAHDSDSSFNSYGVFGDSSSDASSIDSDSSFEPNGPVDWATALNAANPSPELIELNLFDNTVEGEDIAPNDEDNL